MTDLALIVIATAATTAAACLAVFHLYSRSRRRQLARVREQRDTAREDLRQVRLDRTKLSGTWAGQVDEPIAYTIADPGLPVFDGDNTAVGEYAALRDAARRGWPVNS